MIKLKTLLNENSGGITPEDLAKILKHAYISIFDIDDVIIDKSVSLYAPEYCHSYMVVNLAIKYKVHNFYIFHRLHHFKFPEGEIEGIKSNEEWNNMIAKAKGFPTQPTTMEMLKIRSPQIKFKALVYENNNPSGEYMRSEMEHLGDTTSRNILELVTNVKEIIDSEGSDSGENEVPTRPILDPEHQLVEK